MYNTFHTMHARRIPFCASLVQFLLHCVSLAQFSATLYFRRIISAALHFPRVISAFPRVIFTTLCFPRIPPLLSQGDTFMLFHIICPRQARHPCDLSPIAPCIGRYDSFCLTFHCPSCGALLSPTMRCLSLHMSRHHRLTVFHLRITRFLKFWGSESHSPP